MSYRTGTVSFWRSALRAVSELALANRRFRRLSARQILVASGAATLRPAPNPQRELVETVRYFIPRAARRVPWRADCLVQAMAAQRWLATHGIEAALHLGVRKTAGGDLESHAWLSAAGVVVTGWDIARFEEFREIALTDETEPPAAASG